MGDGSEEVVVLGWVVGHGREVEGVGAEVSPMGHFK